MADLNDLLSDRAAAGARYSAAVTELREAYVELAGIDDALKAASVAPHLDVRTFRGDFDQVPWEQRHPEFAPLARNGIAEAVKAKVDQVVKTFDGLPRES